jgi:hypothetical protein
MAEIMTSAVHLHHLWFWAEVLLLEGYVVQAL